MKKNSVGIIGLGSRIRGLTELMKKEKIDLEIDALCDINESDLKAFQTKFAPKAKTYTDYKKLLSDKNLEWIIVGTHNSLHAEIASAALDAGKNVFCEKPLATKTEDGLRICKSLLKSKKKLMIGFTLRYTDHYRKIKELLDSGKIGRITSFEFNETLHFDHGGHIMGCWRRKREFTGSHVLEKCCHDIDLANWLVDSRAKYVASFGGVDFFKAENKKRMDQMGKRKNGVSAYMSWEPERHINPFTSDKDIVDNQVAIIQYENNVRASFHTNLNAGIPERRMYILGTEGAIRADLLTGRIELMRIGFGEEIQNFTAAHKGGHGGGDEVLLSYLQKMITEDAPSLTGIKDGIESAFTCFGIDEAMLGNKVVDMAKYWKKSDGIMDKLQKK